jgi:hypothetical protein
MAKKTNKSEGFACACGKGDLYENWIKLNEDKNAEGTDTTNSKQTNEENSSYNDTTKED